MNKVFDAEIRFKSTRRLRERVNSAAAERGQTASELARVLLRDGLQRMAPHGANQPAAVG